MTSRFNTLVANIRTAFAGIVDAIVGPFQRAWERVKAIADRIRDALQAINPFARFSPSLVDNVRAGVAAIQSEYAKLERLQLPALAGAQAGAAGAAMAGAGISAYHGPLVIVQNMTVRTEEDIQKISRLLQRDIQAGIRARGGR